MINETQIKDAVADLCGLIRNQKIRSTEQDKIFEIFRTRFNEYLDEWRELISRNESEAHNLFGFMSSSYNNDLFKQGIYFLSFKLYREKNNQVNYLKRYFLEFHTL